MNRWLWRSLGLAAIVAVGCGKKSPDPTPISDPPSSAPPGIRLVESTAAPLPPEAVIFAHDSQAVLLMQKPEPGDVLHRDKMKFLIGSFGSKDALGTWYNTELSAAGFTPDRKLLVSVHPESIDLRKVENGQHVRTVKTQPHAGKPVVFSPDGSRMAVAIMPNAAVEAPGGRLRGRVFIQVWNTATWELLGTCGEELYETPAAIALTDDPAVAVSLIVPEIHGFAPTNIDAEGKLTTWSLKAGTAVSEIKLALGPVKRDMGRFRAPSVALASNGKTLAWVAENGAVWTASEGPPKLLTQDAVSNWIIGLSADGKTLMTQGAKREASPSDPLKEFHVRVWDRATGTVKQELVVGRDPRAWASPDLKHLILWHGAYSNYSKPDLKDKLLLYSVPE